MEIFILLIAIVVVVSLIMGIYSTNKHFKVKEREIMLEQERLNLERKRLELEEKKV
ncbi:cell division protein FtsL [Virgibacillus litoralis]|uniref:Cell division protein FtsL n=1 Tax=Virgibacillus litoralis TaxID=578221 RepID=A0ABS4H9G5_9BACI|nr:cell division protein FtsL [Virgibacillus litoralis]MBP1947541.1 cell division protein FtsL [Virgibacillus litoralis]